ncbi:MAG TPA: TfoX/Sxy family protein [Nitrospiria bacterium]|jgi:DNA transformation protein
MSRYSEFLEFVVEQMSFLGRPRVRAMFGGHGVYQDNCIFAIIIEDRLYFKGDPTTRSEFEAKGLNPFTYVARGKSVTMQYFEAPPEVFEEPEAMRSRVQKALGVALRAKGSKTPNKALNRTRQKRRAG